MRGGLALGLASLLIVAAPAVGAELTVAAAPSAREALEEVASAFEHATGHDVTFVVASSGKLYAQLRSGLPCALFFSADDVYPAKLHAEGRAETPRRSRPGIGRCGRVYKALDESRSHGTSTTATPGQSTSRWRMRRALRLCSSPSHQCPNTYCGM